MPKLRALLKRLLSSPLYLLTGLGLLAMVGGGLYLSRQATQRIHTSAPLEARLELAAGDVTLDDGSGPTRPGSGAAIPGGSKISAAEGARALLRLSDGAAVFLRGGTTVALESSAVRLDSGELWLDAPPEERRPVTHRAGNVELNAADAGLSLRFEKNTVTVYVARGQAVVTAPGGRVEVQAGERATVSGDARPEIKPVAIWNDWTGGMGDHAVNGGLTDAGAGVLYGVDAAASAGQKPIPLEITRQDVRAVIRDGFAETEVDQTFFNPSDRPLEGWYWFTLPAEAAVTGFMLESNGVLIAGELIERREAVAQYGAAVSAGNDPALLEWIDGRTYRARIYPVAAGGSRRVVVRYLELSPLREGRLQYCYPMHSRRPVRIGEFSLSVDLGKEGTGLDLSTLAEARIEEGGKLVTLRRSGYTPRADFLLEGRPRRSRSPVTLSSFNQGHGSADYLMMRYLPDIDWSSQSSRASQVVVVVDTSAGGDEADRQLKASTAEAILRALSSDDAFALVSIDIKPTVLYPAEGLAKASGEEIAKALEQLAEHPAGGATDLSAFFDLSLSRLHGGQQPSIVYVGDGIPTSGDTRAEALIERLRRTMGPASARLFTVGVGSDSDFTLLSALARVGGGQAFAVDAPDQATEQALKLVSLLKTPTLTDLEIDLGAGLDEVFLSANGKVSRGEEVMLLARTHQSLPRRVRVKGRLAGEPFERSYPLNATTGPAAALAAPLWAAESIRRTMGSADEPELVRGKITSMGLQYGLMTPYTSYLALASEDAYAQQGINRRNSGLGSIRLAGDVSSSETDSSGLSGLAAPIADKMMLRRDRLAEEAPRMLEAEAAVNAPARGIAGSAPSADSVSVPAAPSVAEAGGAEYKEQAQRANSILKDVAGFQAAKAKAEPMDVGADSREAAMPSAAAPSGRPGPAGVELMMKKVSQLGVTDGNRGSSSDARKSDSLAATGVTGDRCSDLSTRPLPERAILWRKRLQNTVQRQAPVEVFNNAMRACELSDWKAQSLLLRLIEEELRTENMVTEALQQLSWHREAQRYLAQLILRHATDEQVVAAVDRTLFGSQVDWSRLDLELSGISDRALRLQRIRQAVALAPESPKGNQRLVQALVDAGRADEALQLARRLSEQGWMTPVLAEAIGSLLAELKRVDDAVRIYSEIVEFDRKQDSARQRLGDLFLAHGWYEPAYRQYQALVAADASPEKQLRLATAAAGLARVDEGLRIARSIAESEGVPGPRDPRRFARLWSAARLADLLQNPPTGESAGDLSPEEFKAGAIRKLKELQLFRSEGTLTILTWENLDVSLALSSPQAGADSMLGENTDAASVGIYAAMGGTGDATLEARLRSTPFERPLSLKVHRIAYDGKAFQVSVKEVTLPARASSVAL